MASDKQQSLFGAPAPAASTEPTVPRTELEEASAPARKARRSDATTSRTRGVAGQRVSKKAAVLGAVRTDRAGRPRVYLVDGPNIAYRAHYAIRGLVNRRGEATGALYGFVSMLFALLQDEDPDYVAVIWDPRGKVFRHDLYADYKGTRPDMPDELKHQIPIFPRLTRALGFPFIVMDNYEADDVIGTLVTDLKDTCDLTIVTCDKDMMALVEDPAVHVLDTMKNVRVGPDQVVERWGVRPDQIVEILALMGDSSDNIPGVPGIGQKGAVQLLQEWGTVANAFAHVDELAGRVRKPMQAEGARQSAEMSHALATIKTDIPLALTLSDLAFSFPPVDPEPAKELLQELEFHKFLSRLGGTMTAVDVTSYRCVTTLPQLEELAAELQSAETVALDVESTPHVATEASIVGLGFCTRPEYAWYVPLGHVGEGRERQLSQAVVLDRLGPVLAARKVIGHDTKRDLVVLGTHGVELGGLSGDTMIADYLLNPTRRSHALDSIALTTLQHTMIPFEEATKPWGGELANVPLDQATKMGGEDAHVVFLCHPRVERAMAAAGVSKLYREVEVPLVPVLAGMERWGVGLDRSLLGEMSIELAARSVQALARCHELAGGEFNPNSPKQLARILFDELGLPVIKKTKTGPSTDASVLEQLAAEHDLPAAVLTYRTLEKLRSTYVDALPGFVNPRTGRIHTTFNQALAETGRLSSEDPNVQNIPIRTPEGRKIRQAFVPAPGFTLMSADYSQVELRVLAHLCGAEGGFARAFAAGRDVHRATAAEVFDLPEDEVTREVRSAAKAINFGLVYGQGAWGLSHALNISRKEASAYIRKYKARYPEIERYMEERVAEAKEKQYTTTILGRRRRITDLTSSNYNQREAAKRLAINTPVQGSAADIIKVAMIQVAKMLAEEFPEARLLLQVHDELLFEVPHGQQEALAARVVAIMETAVPLSVPLKVDTGSGSNWDEAH